MTGEHYHAYQWSRSDDQQANSQVELTEMRKEARLLTTGGLSLELTKNMACYEAPT